MSGQISGNLNFDNTGSVNKFRFSSANKQHTNKRKRISTISTELAETSAVQSAKKLSSNVLQNSEQNHEEKQVPKKLKSEKFFENVKTQHDDQTNSTNKDLESNLKSIQEKFKQANSITHPKSNISTGSFETNSKKELDTLSNQLKQLKTNSSGIKKITTEVNLNKLQNHVIDIFVYKKDGKLFETRLTESKKEFFHQEKAKGNVAYIAFGKEIGEAAIVLGSEEFFKDIENSKDLEITPDEDADEEVKNFVKNTKFEFFELNEKQINVISEFFSKSYVEIEENPFNSKEKSKPEKNKRIVNTASKNQEPIEVQVEQKEKVTKIERKEPNTISRQEIEQFINQLFYNVKLYRLEELKRKRDEAYYRYEAEENAQELAAEKRADEREIRENRNKQTFNEKGLSPLKILNINSLFIQTYLSKNL